MKELADSLLAFAWALRQPRKALGLAATAANPPTDAGAGTRQLTRRPR